MNEIELAEKARHLYFCLLVALRLQNRNPFFYEAHQKRRFILNWLRRAKEQKLFHRDLACEIDWLTEDIAGGTMSGIEIRLLYIYQEIGKLISNARNNLMTT